MRQPGLTPYQHAVAVMHRHEDALLHVPGVVGVGVGGGPCIQVLVRADDPGTRRQLPAVLDGVRVVTEVIGDIVAM
jgi:hypothetical protein